MAKFDLLDVNVWIALTAPDHTHHDRSRRYWSEQSAPKIVFNTHTALGLVRILSTAPYFNGKPLMPQQAWALYESWRSDSAVEFLEQPSTCFQCLDTLVQSGVVRSRSWSDAYLAAFAKSAGVRLVSFDSDFGAYPGLNLLHLTL